jgi:formylglycine-generating enzyme required for sulfatase activity
MKNRLRSKIRFALMGLTTIYFSIAASLGNTHAESVSLQPGAVFQDCADCPEMVIIPTGEFEMGFDGGEEERYEGPVHTVSIARAFAVGRFEITTAQYAQFINESDHESAKGCYMWDGKNATMIETADWRDPVYGRPSWAQEPVACVDWNDVKAYVNWLAEKTGQPYRLLTEAEWEYAAKAGSKTTFTWGASEEDACLYGNIFDKATIADQGLFAAIAPTGCHDGYSRIAPVGQYLPNAFGLHDMSGNVWEWTEDCYVMPYADKPIDGTAYLKEEHCDRRSVRGGSWMTGGQRQRPTFRGRDPMDRVSQVFGFRIARDSTASIGE